MKDIINGIKHIGAVLVLMLLFILIATSEKNLAIILGGAALGTGAAFVVAALENQKVAPKFAIGWGVIGLVAGILYAFFGV